MDDDTASPAITAVPRQLPRWLWLLGLAAALLTAAQCLMVSYMASGWSAPVGVTGLHRSDACDAERFCPATAVTPGSAAARAGIVAGDPVRLDRFWERRRSLEPGDVRGVTVRRGPTERHITLLAAAGPPLFAPTLVIGGLASASVCLVALLILGRSGRRPSAFLLGCALVSVGVPGGYPRLWENEEALYPLFFAGLAVAYMAAPVLMLATLRAFRREVTGFAPRWLDALVWLCGVTAALATLWGTAIEFASAPILGVVRGLLVTSITWSLGSLLGPVALAAGWRDVPSAERTRYAFMWLAVGVISVRALVDPIIQATGNRYVAATWPVVLQLASQLLGAALLAYAILRHRVIDLGFAINRTLVFSALSFVVLLSFGLVEWGTEKLLPVESHEASVLIEAAMALALFLAFHHIHGWVERTVERVFFHRWHDNEAWLNRFLHQAPFIGSPEVLAERAVAEFRRFAGGAEVALYRTEEGAFVLVAGHATVLSLRIDPDDPALVAMRADRCSVRDAFEGGGLALPMLHRADVTGFVVFSAKPSGDPYRPDEEAALAEATQRVGLDLYALKVEELEAANARLRMQAEAAAA